MGNLYISLVGTYIKYFGSEVRTGFKADPDPAFHINAKSHGFVITLKVNFFQIQISGLNLVLKREGNLSSITVCRYLGSYKIFCTKSYFKVVSSRKIYILLILWLQTEISRTRCGSEFETTNIKTKLSNELNESKKNTQKGFATAIARNLHNKTKSTCYLPTLSRDAYPSTDLRFWAGCPGPCLLRLKLLPEDLLHRVGLVLFHLGGRRRCSSCCNSSWLFRFTPPAVRRGVHQLLDVLDPHPQLLCLADRRVSCRCNSWCAGCGGGRRRRLLLLQLLAGLAGLHM